jgi:hypothetical protein
VLSATSYLVNSLMQRTHLIFVSHSVKFNLLIAPRCAATKSITTLIDPAECHSAVEKFLYCNKMRQHFWMQKLQNVTN